jgi:hypothetical protein
MDKIMNANRSSAPVPSPNCLAIEEYLQKHSEQDEKIIFDFQLDILQADDISDYNNRGNTS